MNENTTINAEVLPADDAPKNQLPAIVAHPIRTVWAPKAYDLNIVEAVRRAKAVAAGEIHFPGITADTLDLRLSESIVHQPDDYFFNRGELVLGGGGGEFARSPNEKMTKRLGIVEDGPLLAITEAVRQKKQSAEEVRTRVDSLLKALPRVCNRYAAFNHLESILNYLHHRLIHRPDGKPGELTATKLFESMCKGTKPEFTHVRAIESMRDLIQTTTTRKNKYIFEIAFVIESIVRMEEDQAEAKKLSKLFLEAMYLDEIAYWEAYDAIAAAPKFKIGVKDRVRKGRRKAKGDRKPEDYENREMEVTAACVTGNNPHFRKASQKQNVGLLLVRNKTGNVGIFVDTRLRLNLDFLRVFVHQQELLRAGLMPDEISNMDLRGKGHPDVAKKWKFVHSKGMLVNGISQSDVAATDLGTDILVDAIQHAFHPGFRARWRARRGIVIPRQQEDEPVANQPMPGVNPASEAKVTENPVETLPASAAGESSLEAAITNAKPKRVRRKTSSKDEATAAA